MRSINTRLVEICVVFLEGMHSGIAFAIITQSQNMGRALTGLSSVQNGMLISWGIEPNAHICEPYFMGRYRSIYTNRCNYADIHANKDLCIGTVRYTCVRIKRNGIHVYRDISVNMHTCSPAKKS